MSFVSMLTVSRTENSFKGSRDFFFHPQQHWSSELENRDLSGTSEGSTN